MWTGIGQTRNKRGRKEGLKLQYFSKRYDLKHPYIKEVETLDLLYTGLRFGFVQVMMNRLFEINPGLEPIKFTDDLVKWSQLPLNNDEQVMAMMKEIMGWSEDYFRDVYRYGINTLYLFTPKTLALFFATFKSSSGNVMRKSLN